ncbi:kirola-like [Benincasa hispida]|uniref:kirola-like n=1 Tax=Benincasa hispida TaxID=102211 RepID=UPI0019001447|nr:kirola-like [Benincasa hispida]
MSQSDSIIVAKVELKSPIQNFYGFFRNHLGDLVNLFPELYQSIHLVEGEHLSAGSVIQFKYHLGHQLVSEKWSMRVVDDTKRYIIYEAVEGDMRKYYKVLRTKLEAVNGGLNKVGGSFAKWTVEYEKAYENVPSPENYMELFVRISKGVDAYLNKN